MKAFRLPDWMKISLQITGGLLGVLMLIYAVTLALSEKNQEAYGRVVEAPLVLLAAVVGLTVFRIWLNGFVFWVTLRPLREQVLAQREVQAVNAVATFLAVLPFKLSIAMRVAVHARRHGMGVKEIATWFACMGALTGVVLVCFACASVWRGGLDAWWFAASFGGMAGLLAVGCVLSRFAMSQKWLQVMSLGVYKAAGDWLTVVLHSVGRAVEIFAASGLFLVTAHIAGIDLPASGAVLVGVTYFALSVLAPAGQLGFREGGTAFVAGLAGLDVEQVALLALLMSAVEVAVSAVLFVPCAWAVRLDRVLGVRWP